MKEGDLVMYEDNWGEPLQALFIRHVTKAIVEIVRMDGLRIQCATSHIKKGVSNEDR